MADYLEMHEGRFRQKLTQAEFDEMNQLAAFYRYEFREAHQIPGDEIGDWDFAKRELEKAFFVEPAA